MDPICDRLAQVLQAPNKPAQALLLNSSQGTEGPIEGFMEAQKMETTQAPSSVMSLVQAEITCSTHIREPGAGSEAKKLLHICGISSSHDHGLCFKLI
ncbi:Cadherin-related family member 4, partial [Camelus dromedarius]